MICGKASIVRKRMALSSYLFGIVVLSIGVITFTCWKEEKEYPSSDPPLNLTNSNTSHTAKYYECVRDNIIAEIKNSKRIQWASGLVALGGFIQLLCPLMVVGKNRWLLWLIFHFLIGILSFIGFIIPFFLVKPWRLGETIVEEKYANYFHSFSSDYESSLLTPLDKHIAKGKFVLAVSFLMISLINSLISIMYGVIMFRLRNTRDRGPN